jgi:hypothetical protein
MPPRKKQKLQRPPELKISPYKTEHKKDSEGNTRFSYTARFTVVPKPKKGAVFQKIKMKYKLNNDKDASFQTEYIEAWHVQKKGKLYANGDDTFSIVADLLNKTSGSLKIDAIAWFSPEEFKVKSSGLARSTAGDEPWGNILGSNDVSLYLVPKTGTIKRSVKISWKKGDKAPTLTVL